MSLKKGFYFSSFAKLYLGFQNEHPFWPISIFMHYILTTINIFNFSLPSFWSESKKTNCNKSLWQGLYLNLFNPLPYIFYSHFFAHTLSSRQNQAPPRTKVHLSVKVLWKVLPQAACTRELTTNYSPRYVHYRWVAYAVKITVSILSIVCSLYDVFKLKNVLIFDA